jgi:hypothetical protein
VRNYWLQRRVDKGPKIYFELIGKFPRVEVKVEDNINPGVGPVFKSTDPLFVKFCKGVKLANAGTWNTFTDGFVTVSVKGAMVENFGLLSVVVQGHGYSVLGGREEGWLRLTCSNSPHIKSKFFRM